MRNLNQTVGEFVPDKLILDPSYPQQVGSGIFAEQLEPLFVGRGQLLAKDETGNLIVATALTKGNLTVCLMDTMVETGTVVEVLVAGAVNAGGIIVGAGESVYDYKDDLRSVNIYIKNTIGGM